MRSAAVLAIVLVNEFAFYRSRRQGWQPGLERYRISCAKLPIARSFCSMTSTSNVTLNTRGNQDAGPLCLPLKNEMTSRKTIRIMKDTQSTKREINVLFEKQSIDQGHRAGARDFPVQNRMIRPLRWTDLFATARGMCPWQASGSGRSVYHEAHKEHEGIRERSVRGPVVVPARVASEPRSHNRSFDSAERRIPAS